MRAAPLLAGALLAALVAGGAAGAKPRPTFDKAGCSFDGHPLRGKVQVVEHFPDVKVQVVTAFPDLKVQLVEHFPDACGEWQLVERFPDLKVQFVERFPDVKIQYVQHFPGAR